MRYQFVSILFLTVWPILVSLPLFAQEPGTARIFVQKKVFNKEGKDGSYEMNISYPNISYDNEEVSHHINLGIQQLMSLAINEFQEKVQGPEGKKEIMGYNSLSLDFETYCRVQEVVSLRFTKSTFLDGSSGVAKAFRTLNYDMQTGRPIPLDELFLESVDYEKELVSIIKKELGNCRLRASNLFQTFCISPEHLIFTLDESNVNARNCDGEFKIYWRDISHLINPESIGARFL